jgi:quinolinate synthase
MDGVLRNYLMNTEISTSQKVQLSDFDIAGQSSFLKDSIPDEYYRMPIKEVHERGLAAKKKLADDVLILAHHYQRDETFFFGDVVGDSLKLAQVAAESPAKNIIFCGVHFMAESADIITADHQSVILPNLSAGCSMADMADLDQVEDCWDVLTEVRGENSFIPITYINSSATLKAFCGKHGGIVCTSSNADKVLKWAFDQDKAVLFFPDQHLGRNTGNNLGVPKKLMNVWERTKDDGGLTDDEIKKSKILLWDGFCSIHGRFSVGQVEAARKRNPDVKIIVHPECTAEVVEVAEYNGSTNKIIQTIRDSEAGTSWAVGTEVNLVQRLHRELFASEGKHIECLNPNVCLCSTMYRTHPANVLWILDNLLEGKVVNQIKVPEETAKYAKIALDRMLEIS